MATTKPLSNQDKDFIRRMNDEPVDDIDIVDLYRDYGEPVG